MVRLSTQPPLEDILFSETVIFKFRSLQNLNFLFFFLNNLSSRVNFSVCMHKDFIILWS